MMDEVNDKSFDVTSIMILIGHDHQRPVSQRPGVCIDLVHLKPDYLDNVLNLVVIFQDRHRSVSYIEHLSFQRVNSKFISSNDFDPTHS